MFVYYVLLLIKICIQYCGCSPLQFCGIKEPPLSQSCTFQIAALSKRGVPVKDLKQIEKFGQKVVKLKLDVKYFELCTDLSLCPEFLKFRPPKLKVYEDSNDFHRIVVLRKLTLIPLLMCYILS